MSEVDGVAKKPSSDLAATQLESRSPLRSKPEVTLDSSKLGPGSFAAGAVAQEPRLIGPYQLIRKLGEGGMGQVWLAEQTAPIKRQVALKLIRVGRYDDSVLQRFYTERQSLAIMDHPSIAKVFDAGATPDGQPYFVMEYVPGRPITDYCDRNRLTIRERLELFIKVCEGVQHAHQKAVIHRDLKPANILIVEVDGKPVPRIIDFGLAKPATLQLDGQTLVTDIGCWVGTPGYMSPEQADSSVIDVDTRTDVYSLGAVLYVLLTGFLPFETDDWRKQRIEEFLRRLRDEDPPRPSTKIRLGKESSQAAAEARGTEGTHLTGLLQGDLDWITMKALEKDRARRYGTPMELATDIERYLANEPILARPASTSYRLKKYVRRHRLSVAAVSGLVLLLAGFAVMQAVQIRRVTRERDRANRITEFMKGMFKVLNPSEARGNTITAREILDRASTQVDTGLASDPQTQAQLMAVMGDVYETLGLYPRAHPLLERALATQKRLLGTTNPETLSSMDDLAYLLNAEGHPVEAEKLDREVLEARRQLLGKEHPDTLVSMRHLGWALFQEGHFQEAEKLARETVELDRRVFGSESSETARTINNLAAIVQSEGHYTEAERLNREALEIRQRVLGPDDPDTLKSMDNLAGVLMEEARFDDAINMFKEVLEIERRVMGPEHPDTLANMASLAWTLQQSGHYAEADKLEHQTLEIQRRVLGAEHADTLRTTTSLAVTLAYENRLPEAEKLFREVLNIRRRTFGPEHRDTLLAYNNLAEVLGMESHYAEQEKALNEVLATQNRVLGPEHPDTLLTVNGVGYALLHQRRYEEAASTYKQALEIERRVLAPNHPLTATSEYNLACALAHTGQGEEALSLLREAVDHGLETSTDAEMGNDKELGSLHRDPRFDAIVAHAKEVAAEKSKSVAPPVSSSQKAN